MGVGLYGMKLTSTVTSWVFIKAWAKDAMRWLYER